MENSKIEVFKREYERAKEDVKFYEKAIEKERKELIKNFNAGDIVLLVKEKYRVNYVHPDGEIMIYNGSGEGSIGIPIYPEDLILIERKETENEKH